MKRSHLLLPGYHTILSNIILKNMRNKLVKLIQKEYKKNMGKVRLLLESSNDHYRFFHILTKNKTALFYDHQTKLLWDGKPDILDKPDQKDEALKHYTQTNLDGILNWRRASQEDIQSVAQEDCFPFSTALHNTSRFHAWTGKITARKVCLLLVVECPDILKSCVQHGWKLRTIKSKPDDDLLANAYIDAKMPVDSKTFIALFKEIDHISARLPILDDVQFTDPNKGIWEIFNISPDIISDNHKIIARDPEKDVKDWNIAIDFGTSSTVVAYREGRRDKLLEIGANNTDPNPKPEHYENPTVLSFIDFSAMKEAWLSEAYRPMLDWDDIHCSHEALNELSNVDLGTKELSSILTRIKQWALRDREGERVLITDRNGHEHKLDSLTERQPVTGQKLTVTQEDLFDPIELYAYFLGLTINSRHRGLFLRYYMTFPVAYPQAIKQKILASFRRGIQRSLPETLINQTIVFNMFSIEECASEPAAYAVSAFNVIELEPTETGLAYAVFDFGGGTTDFDFGYYRLPSSDEMQKEPWEAVLEQLDASGDRFLGGENLLENMAYKVFRKNLQVCKDNKIKFSKPLDADDFPGCQHVLDNTQTALTNTQLLISALRPLWEQNKDITDKTGIKEITLINYNNVTLPCELKIPIEELTDYLETRIEQGVENFYTSLRQAFQSRVPDKVHVLLGGNASRSHIVLGFFDLSDDENGQRLYERTKKWLPEDMKFTFHKPLPSDENHVYQATAKTGVALGLLDLCPGGSIKLVKCSIEAPFAFFVGWIRQKKFAPNLMRGAQYHKWYLIGQLMNGVFNIVYTQSPRPMKHDDLDLTEKRVFFTGNKDGYSVFARAVSPNEIEVCAAKSEADIKDKGGIPDIQKLSLI